MSKFFVGQRVRIVRDDGHSPEAVGREGRITAFDAFARCLDTGRRFAGFDVAVEGLKDGGAEWCYCFEEHQLEPIIPEGMKPARWEDCAWQPDTEVVTESAPTQRIADEVSLALETIALTGRRV